MILFSHPLGNANARHAALALEEAHLLEELWTCLHWTPGNRFERWLPASIRRELGRRAFPAAVRSRVRTAPMREAARLLASRIPQIPQIPRFLQVPGASWLTRHEAGPFSVDAVFRALDRSVARRVRDLAGKGQAPGGVYAYEDGAAETFRAASDLGLRRIYDLPIGYWRAAHSIFDEEAAREPEWASTMTGLRDSAAKLARKDEELRLADAVIVASSFTRATLAQAPGLSAPIHVIPYGAPVPPSGDSAGDSSDDSAGSERNARPSRTSRPAGAPLRVLFAGSLGQRKGLSYLLEAVRSLGARGVQLTLLGTRTVEGCRPLDQAVREHRWIPSLSHPEVLAEMGRQDVLVFPSLFEGFGLVILEAMSRGLPVIATAHTGGPDVIEEGVEGFIVPIRSAVAIAEKLELFLAQPDRLAEMKQAARRKAATLGWEAYRRSLAASVRNVLDHSPRQGSLSPIS